MSMNLRRKIVLIGVSQLALTGAVLFWVYYRDTTERIQQQYVERARSILLTAESTREAMGRKWEKGVFTAQQLRDWADKGETAKVFESVPVVTAWGAAAAKAKEGGYEFRVPKVQPRNPKNQPDPVELQALDAFTRQNLTEYTQIDHEHNAIRYFRPVRLTAECLLCHGDPASSVQVWGNDKGRDPTGATMENWKVGEVHGAFEIIQSLDQANAELRNALIRNGSIILVLIVAGGAAFFWLLTRSVIRPVRAMIAVSKRIAAGDLTQTCAASSQDEISELARSMNAMSGSLKSMVGELLGKSQRVSGSAQQLCTTAGRLASGAEKTDSQSATISAAAEEMSINMKNMAGSTEQMSGNVKTVAAAVEEMTASISEVARSAEQAATVAESAAQLAESSNAKIAELGDAAEEIGKVIVVIQDIAEQTNLLALNATIEAARAGEAGKGFSVVATEVKALARQTAGATEGIRKRIEGIQGSTRETVQSLSEIGQVIKRVNEVSRTIAAAVEEQSITTREIARNVSGTAVAADTIAAGVSESALASQEITRNMVGVSQAAAETTQGAGQARAAGEDLLAVAQELQEMVSIFKVSGE